MPRAWKIALLVLVVFLLATAVSLSWGAPQNAVGTGMPAFADKDRKVIEDYYLHLAGTLAPGSLDRSAFPLGVEQTLASGSRVPMQLEKELKPLPAAVESQLSALTGEYSRYALGRHVVLVRKGDLAIADILKNVAIK